MLKLVALGVSGAMLAVGGGFGVNHLLQKDVTLTVDGVSQTLSVASPTVAGVLVSQGVTLGEHDVVSPRPADSVTDGQQIEVRYGREITAIVDGVPRTFWTTALTVEEAVNQLNVRAQNFTLSTSRSTPIGREGLDFEVDTQFAVTITAGGKSHSVKTSGTVDDAVKQAGLSYDADDVLTPAASTPVTEGLSVKLVKVDLVTSTKTVKVAHASKTEKSSTLAKGETEVKTKGKDGTTVETWVVRKEDGVAVSQKKQSAKVTAAPVTEVKLAGTKAPATDSSDSASSTGSTSNSSSSSSSSSGSSSNLDPATGNSCKASYYWQGQMTANGEQFNTNDFTAAHKTLAFGTRVKVTNKANGKTTVVRINDRGPYISGRCLDLSRAAMSAIGGTSAGVISVTWEVV